MSARVTKMRFTLDARFVQEAEKKLGRTLPIGYVSRMCRSNGGQVSTGADEFELHPICDTSDRKRLARTCNDIIRETAVARKWHGFPREAIAIGANGCGDRLVFLPDSETSRFSDAVHWWNHETGELEFVADSFDKLA